MPAVKIGLHPERQFRQRLTQEGGETGVDRLDVAGVIEFVAGGEAW